MLGDFLVNLHHCLAKVGLGSLEEHGALTVLQELAHAQVVPRVGKVRVNHFYNLIELAAGGGGRLDVHPKHWQVLSAGRMVVGHSENGGSY
jgi:hypothetical protein